MRRERLVQQRNGNGIARQDDACSSLMRDQPLDGRGHIAGEVYTAVLYPALVILVIESAGVALTGVKFVILWPGHLVQEARRVTNRRAVFVSTRATTLVSCSSIRRASWKRSGSGSSATRSSNGTPVSSVSKS